MLSNSAKRRSNLRFKLKDIEENGFKEMDFECRYEELELFFDDTKFLNPIKVHVQAFRQGEDVFARFDVDFTVIQECRRCLEPFEEKLHTHFELQYRPLKEGEVVDEFQDEAEGISRYREEVINIADDVRKYIVLEIPLWPLCDENCKGLCPYCGQNRNYHDCDCEEKERLKSSKFAVLADLIK
ncbi:TPA: DUF177 domain-containing protein [Candidatus Poribacteria bacterium]|nr:DUF177 domain-containing protein [Candidatus Poribacteria bacterium]HEX30879.1 DUF177 domain-containing protein [Candidatus Poribacteria bacterium]